MNTILPLTVFICNLDYLYANDLIKKHSKKNNGKGPKLIWELINIQHCNGKEGRDWCHTNKDKEWFS